MIRHSVDLILDFTEEGEVAGARGLTVVGRSFRRVSAAHQSHFDSRKSRFSERAVQIRAACGAGLTRIVNVEFPAGALGKIPRELRHRPVEHDVMKESPQAARSPSRDWYSGRGRRWAARSSTSGPCSSFQ